MSWCSNNIHPFLLRQGPPWLSSLCHRASCTRGQDSAQAILSQARGILGTPTPSLFTVQVGQHSSPAVTLHPISPHRKSAGCSILLALAVLGCALQLMGLGKGTLPKIPAQGWGWGCAKPLSAAPKACRHPQVTSPRKAVQDACAAQGSRWIPWAGQASRDGHLQRAIREAPDSQMGCCPPFPV